MLGILEQGGVTAIPLVICSITAIAVALERFIYLKKAEGNNFRLIKKIKLMLGNDKLREAKNMAQKEDGPIAGILTEGFKYYGKKKEDLKDNLEAVAQSEIKKLEKRLRVLDFIANVAPLLGLLGTVLGIIDSFNILAGAEGMASPEAISVGISHALISTAFGLIVAIPTMLLYSYLVSLVEQRTEEVNRWFIDLIDLLSQGGSNAEF